MVMTAERILLYVDESTEPGKQAIGLFDRSPVPVSTIPVKSTIPEATYDKARYVGLPEIRILASAVAHLFAQ